jgi:hypothetical protein
MSKNRRALLLPAFAVDCRWCNALRIQHLKIVKSGRVGRSLLVFILGRDVDSLIFYLRGLRMAWETHRDCIILRPCARLHLVGRPREVHCDVYRMKTRAANIAYVLSMLDASLTRPLVHRMGPNRIHSDTLYIRSPRGLTLADYELGRCRLTHFCLISTSALRQQANRFCDSAPLGRSDV